MKLRPRGPRTLFARAWGLGNLRGNLHPIGVIDSFKENWMLCLEIIYHAQTPNAHDVDNSSLTVDYHSKVVSTYPSTYPIFQLLSSRNLHWGQSFRWIVSPATTQ